ncbi:MAG: PTS sugar transporter subunit IIC [Hungatella sp.]|nr:PTS sugar transporter subunit IIC [Hungatella sp.]
MLHALLMAFVYWLGQCADAYTGWQTFTRPIVFGTIAGIFFGDVKTGIILGAELEAVYMGVSSIGGEAPSNYQAATVLCVGFVVLSGADMATGLALAVTIGTLINAVKPFTEAVKILFHSRFLKLAENGEVKKFRRLMWVQMLCADQLIPTMVVFVVALGGSMGLEAFITHCPGFILRGLNAAAGMLVVVGLCLTTQAIWNGAATVMYVLLGFVLTKFLGLGTLPVAVMGIVIAFVFFQNSSRMKAVEDKRVVAAGDEEGDDFFG